MKIDNYFFSFIYTKKFVSRSIQFLDMNKVCISILIFF